MSLRPAAVVGGDSGQHRTGPIRRFLERKPVRTFLKRHLWGIEQPDVNHHRVDMKQITGSSEHASYSTSTTSTLCQSLGEVSITSTIQDEYFPPSTLDLTEVKEAVQEARYYCGYEILDTLGNGMSGKVKRGRCPETGSYVALKIIDKQRTPCSVLSLLKHEVKALRTLKGHPHILPLLRLEDNAVYPRKNGGTRNTVCLALPLAVNGQLFDYMMYTGPFQQDIAKGLFFQLVSALAYCHDHNIYHRDIKLENLLLDENFQLKVADFGLAAIRADPEALLRTECGTRSYMAPEVLARQQYDGKKADCWSAGVVLFIMLSGNPPMQMARAGDWWFDQLRVGRPDKFWRSHLRYSPQISRGAQALLANIFEPDPRKRPTPKEVLADPWLKTSCPVKQEVIAKELEKRKRTLHKRRSIELERAKKRKEAGRCAGKMTKDFDPEKVKHRDAPISLPEACLDSSSWLYDGAQAPTADERLVDSSLTSLYSAEAAPYCLRRLRETVALMGGELVTKCSEMESRFKMVAIVPMNGNKVEVEVRLWSVAEGDITLIQVVRREGDLLAFHTIFNQLREETKDLHGGDDDEEEGNGARRKPVRSPTFPEPVDSEDEGEEDEGKLEQEGTFESLLQEEGLVDMI